MKNQNKLSANKENDDPLSYILNLLSPSILFGQEYQTILNYKDIVEDKKISESNEVCRNFVQGDCQFAEKCKFVHAKEEKVTKENEKCYSYHELGQGDGFDEIGRYCHKGMSCTKIHVAPSAPSSQFYFQRFLSDVDKIQEEVTDRLLVFLKFSTPA